MSESIARDYIARGFSPTPVAWGAKRPTLTDWPKLKIDMGNVDQHFNGTKQNIGVVLGKLSGGLADIDLDAPEAVEMAPHFLPTTGAIFGRQGKQRSHWLYVTDNTATDKYADADGTMIVELRGDGHQTVFPHSQHTSDELIQWSSDGEPAKVDYDTLDAAIRMLAVASTIARHWPSKGSRHEAALALAGALLASKAIPPDDIADFIQAVCDAGGSAPDHDHASVVGATMTKIAAGEKVTGWTRLGELLSGDGAKVIRSCKQWLRIKDTKDDAVPTLVLTTMSGVESKAVRWFWQGMIPSGMMTTISADPGVGKSTLLTDMAARTSAGTPWPNLRDKPNPAGDVVLLLSEDALEYTVAPRLQVAGADLSRIHIIEGLRSADGYITPIELDQHIRHIDDILSANPAVKLLGIDTLDAFTGSIDTHRKSEVQRCLSDLASIAEKHDIAIIGILHLRKNSADKALYRTLGSLGFVSAPRAVWCLSRDEEDKSKRLLTCAKLNIAPAPDGLSFEIDDVAGVGCIRWHDAPVTQSADECLGESKPKASAVEDAAAWLEELLLVGPMKSKAVKEAAENDGISWKTINRAKDKVDIRSRKKSDGWEWELIQHGQVT